MTHLKSLTLTVAPHQIERNPKLLRRQRLIERLEEQQTFDFKIALGVLDGESKAEVYEALLALKERFKFSLSEDRKVLDELKTIKLAKAA